MAHTPVSSGAPKWIRTGRLRVLMALTLVVAMFAGSLGPPSLTPGSVHAQTGPDLTLATYHLGTFYIGSTSATYEFSVSNGFSAGPTTGTITLSAILPTGITYHSISGGAGGWTCSTTGQSLTCTNPGLLNASWTHQVRIKVNVNAAAVGERSITATVETPGDTNSANDSDGDTVTVTVNPPPPDLALSGGYSSGFFVGSTTATFGFTVTNEFGGPTTGPITLTDPLPTGMTYNSISGPANGWTCSGTSTVTCTNPGPIEDGGFMFLNIRVNIAAAAVGERTNLGTVSTPGDVNTANNTNTTSPQNVTVTGAPGVLNLSIGQSRSGGFFVGSTNARYNFTVFSSGDHPTTGTTTLTDPLPTGITYNSIDGPADGWSCSGTTTVTCTHPGTIEGGGFSSVTIKVDITAAALGLRSNTATVVTPGDTNPGDNTSNPVAVTVTAGSHALTVTRAGAGSGTVVTFPPGAIDCGTDCSESYPVGATVSLFAEPATGSTFAGWSGACTGLGQCTVTVDAARSVTATFAPANAGVYVNRVPGPPPGSIPSLTSILTARPGCGNISQIQFGKPNTAFSNARVTIQAPAGGPGEQTSGFSYTPPAGTRSVALEISRVVQSGAATVSPISLNDGCGAWQTFVGGGPKAFE